MPFVSVREHLLDRELAHFLAHRGQRLVEARISERRHTRLLGDQLGNARLDLVGEPGLDQHRHSRICKEFRDLRRWDPKLTRANDLALAHRNAAADLREILAERRTSEQLLHLAETPFRIQPPHPPEHLAQRFDVGREPR